MDIFHLKNRKKIFLSLMGIFCAVSSCISRPQAPLPPRVIAFVNGVPIKETDLFLKIKLSRPGQKMTEKLKMEILEEIIRNKVIVDWGDKNGIQLTSEELAHGLEQLKQGYTEREFEIMLEEKGLVYSTWRDVSEENLKVRKIIRDALSPNLTLTAAEVEIFYKNHAAHFYRAESVRVRQIVTDSLEKAAHLKTLIDSGENFARLALTHSLSPDRFNGGDLGFFSKGTHPKEFDEACFSLKEGLTSPVVKSPYGYHLFKLIEKREAGPIPIEEVREKIYTELIQVKMEAAQKKWYEDIHMQAQIQVLPQSLEKVKIE
jgi:peptidyl-prolyl cis-trans isomerase C/foldase protein PrsA